MNVKYIELGIKAWFLGILVPVVHHVLLHWPLAGQQTNNILTRAKSLYDAMPWFEWFYVAAMAIVGIILIISGMRAQSNESGE